MLSRPIVGALICAAGVAAGGMSMTGNPDSFGGCGVTGGDLYKVIEEMPEQSAVCAIPEVPPVAVSK
jgi:hypothetical protein